MKNHIIRWGIIGAGRIAHQFARDIQLTQYGQLCAIAARSLTRANEFAQEYEIDKSYGSYAELFEDPDIDALYIATTHNFHLEQAQAALIAGKAVLCEKPITVNSNECKALINTAKTEKIYLMEAMWSYFLPTIQQAKRWVDEGRIGQLRHVKADFGYPRPYDIKSRDFNPELAGGCLLDMGIYPVAIARYFIPRNPLRMHVISKHAANGIEDDVSMLWDYGDCVASLSTSFRSRLGNACYLLGDKGYIRIPNFHQSRHAYLYEIDELVEEFDDQRLGGGFEFEIEAVNRDLIAGKLENDVMPLSVSLHFQKLMDQVRHRFSG